MKRLASLLIICGSTAWADSKPREVIKLQADVWCPFNCGEKDKDPGYMVEIAKTVFNSIKMDIEYKNLSWNKAIDEARKGQANGIVGAAVTDAPDFTFTSIPLGRTMNCFWTLPDSSWTFNGVDSLKKVRVGVIEGYTYGAPFEDYVSAYFKEKEKDPNAKGKKDVDMNSPIQAVPGDQSLTLNIKKLKAKPSRIDVFVEEVSVLNNHLFSKKMPADSFRNAGCLEPDNVTIAFGPKESKGKEYAKLLSDGVVAMRKDGRLKKILEKYGISDWEK